MGLSRLFAILPIVFCAISLPVHPSEPSTKPAITEGNYIGYANVADALATLKAQGLMAVPGINGEVSFAEPDNKTTWTFAGKNEPAYPSAVRYVYARSRGVLHAEFTILCEASAAERRAQALVQPIEESSQSRGPEAMWRIVER